MRKNWCEFNKEVRKYIKKRDNKRCIYCGTRNGLQIAHIFMSRAKGGKGSKENGVLLCVRCHQICDNPIGNQIKEQTKIIKYCQEYLIHKEDIKDIEVLKKELKYDKMKVQIKYVQEDKNILKATNKCKNCKMCIKKEIRKSTIPIYYCKYKKKRVNKNEGACLKYERK